jgi:hypothetical protein
MWGSLRLQGSPGYFLMLGLETLSIYFRLWALQMKAMLLLRMEGKTSWNPRSFSFLGECFLSTHYVLGLFFKCWGSRGDWDSSYPDGSPQWEVGEALEVKKEIILIIYFNNDIVSKCYHL